MSQMEYASVPLEDEKDDESVDILPSSYISNVRKHRNSRLIRGSLYISLQLLVVVLTAFTSISLSQHWRRTCAGDGLEEGAAIPTENRTIGRIPKDEEAVIWTNVKTLVSGKLPFIWIDDPEKYGLLPGVPISGDWKQGGPRKVYGVSWTHQLHCLVMLRDEFHCVKGELDACEPRTTGEEAFFHSHVEHCWSYLRQIIDCNSDMTVEAAEPGAIHPRINGFGVHHQCRKKESVVAYMKAREPPYDQYEQDLDEDTYNSHDANHHHHHNSDRAPRVLEP